MDHQNVIDERDINTYGVLAHLYDSINQTVDYPQWARYIQRLFASVSYRPKNILELGCGTGTFALLLAREGYRMTCIDRSEDMLAIAKNKALEAGANILFLQQDITKLCVHDTMDAVVCLLDTVNHITSIKALARMFKSVYETLAGDGVFIFDINTEYKLLHLLDGRLFYVDEDAYTLIGQCTADRQKALSNFHFTVFEKINAHYRKLEESMQERAYSITQIITQLRNVGFQTTVSYDGFSFNCAAEKSERIFFLCKK